MKQPGDSDKPKISWWKRSIGEKLFDVAAYGAIGTMLNATLSVVVTDYFRNPTRDASGNITNPRGSEHLAKASTLIGQKLFSNLFPNRSDTWYQKQGLSTAMITLLMTGGTLLMGPIKYLEDHKAGIVGSINNLFGRKASAAEPGSDQDAPEKPVEEPKQSWGSILKGRAAGLAVVYTIFYGFVRQKFSTLHIDPSGLSKPGSLLERNGVTLTANDRVEDFFIKTTTAGGLKLLGKNPVDNPRTKELIDLFTIDSLLSALCMLTLYPVSKIVATRNSNKKKDKANDLEQKIASSDTSAAKPADNFVTTNTAQENTQSTADRIRSDGPRTPLAHATATPPETGLVASV